MKHRLLLQTNPCHIKTGLATNAKTLLRHLWKTGKYDIAHYCTQTSVADPQLRLTPWKSFGCLPADQQSINELNADPNRARNASYGSHLIDQTIKEWKPSIWLGADDIWFCTKGDYLDKPWYKQINSILHVTVDSLPVLDLAYEQARSTKHYLTWAKFAQKEMKRFGGSAYDHVGHIYGAMSTTDFQPISEKEKADLRVRFGIDQDALVFLYVFRNQLRKQLPLLLEGFAQFKRENPGVKAKVHCHTSFSERGNGWDIPKMTQYYGLDPKDILCTYVCKSCKQWFVNPYGGEDLNCPICHAEKSVITTNIVDGVPEEQMKYVYGLSDACLSPHSSGGLEFHHPQSLLCGKMLAPTDYSSGSDFVLPETSDFVYPLRYRPYHEQGTNFIKAATDTGAIAKFMTKIAKSSKRDLQEAGEKGRAWAVKTFGIEAIGAQWEKLFDSMPIKEWSSVTLTAPRKNDTFPMPDASFSNTDFIQSLYKNVLLMDERLEGDGQKHWEEKLKMGMARSEIYKFFIQVAQQENTKNGIAGSAPVDFKSLLDDTGRPRILYVMRESLGDCLMITALFESLHKKYPGHDLYVGTDPKHNAIFAGNPYVHKLLPYIPAMEQEMAMCGAGQKDALFAVYMHPGILTQRQLFYLYS